MKKFFNGVRNLIWRHKLLFLICLCAFVIIFIMLYVFFSVFLGSNGKYGHRLDGISSVKLSNKDLSSVKEDIDGNKIVDSSSIRLVGKIVYIDIVFTKDADSSKAKEIAGKCLEKFDDDEKEFYDFEFILSQDIDNGFNITGTKSPKIDNISWIKS